MFETGNLWYRSLLGKLERPILARAGRELVTFQRGQGIRGGGGGATVPMGTVVDPITNGRDLGGAQCVAFHRHRRLDEPGDGAVEPAVLGTPGHDRGAAVAPFERVLAACEVEARKLEGVAVAVPATALHDGPDVVREIDRGLSHRGGRSHDQRKTERR